MARANNLNDYNCKLLRILYYLDLVKKWDKKIPFAMTYYAHVSPI